jgi:hypothetical protein
MDLGQTTTRQATGTHLKQRRHEQPQTTQRQARTSHFAWLRSFARLFAARSAAAHAAPSATRRCSAAARVLPGFARLAMRCCWLRWHARLALLMSIARCFAARSVAPCVAPSAMRRRRAAARALPGNATRCLSLHTAGTPTAQTGDNAAPSAKLLPRARRNAVPPPRQADWRRGARRRTHARTSANGPVAVTVACLMAEPV